MTDQGMTYNFSEAPASWNTRYIDASGFECQLTLRDTNGSTLLKKASAALAALITEGCTPLASKQATNGNGGSHPQEPPEQMHVCEIHNAELKRHEKDGQVWYSHKLADGTYCRGKKSNSID
jgi:hypothetical protein